MKTFIPKLLLFVFLFLVCQYILGSLVSPINIPQQVKEFKETHRTASILYFGDSTIRTTALQDRDKRAIFEYLDESTPHSVAGLTHDGFDAQIFYEYARVLSFTPKQKRYVIMPINLRSFSDTWSYDFSDQKKYLSLMGTPLYPYITFIDNFKIPLSHNTPQFQGEKVEYGKYDKEVKKLFLKNKIVSYDEGMRMRIASYYLYTLSQNNTQLNALVAATKLLKNTNTQVIFYITPVDFQTGEKYFGKDFEIITKKNASLISSTITKNGGDVVDLSHTLKSSNFAWQGIGFINEHLNEKGRKFVAASLAKRIK